MDEQRSSRLLETRPNDEQNAAKARGDETVKRTYVTAPDQEGILVCDGEIVVDVIYGY